MEQSSQIFSVNTFYFCKSPNKYDKINMFSRTVESGVQLFSRMKLKGASLDGINSHFFPDGGPYGNQIIEVNAHEAVDYINILIDFIAKAILPSKYSEEFKGVQVILFNLDLQINLLKIIKILEKKLEPFVISYEKRSVVEQALRNLIFLNCFSPEQFEVTIYSLDSIIDQNKSTGLVVLDNILSHYWHAKFNNVKLSFDEYSNKILNMLHDRLKDWKIVLMYGKQTTNDSKRSWSQLLGYSIEIVRNTEEYVANIQNYEKKSNFSVSFKVPLCLEFL